MERNIVNFIFNTRNKNNKLASLFMNSNRPLFYPSVLLADYNRCLIVQLQCFKHITFLLDLFIIKVSHLRLFESLKPKQKIIRTITVSMT